MRVPPPMVLPPMPQDYTSVVKILPSLLIALLFIGCEPDPGPSPTGGLNVLTYNVHGLPATIAGDDPAGRMPQINPLLAGYDIVGLQEAWVDEFYDALVAGTDRTTEVRFDLPLTDDRVYGAGLAVLADYTEVVEARVQRHYTQCNGTLDAASDCLASKGFQLVRLHLADWAGVSFEVDVWNTHFEAGGGDADIAARQSHVDDLTAAMIEHSAGRAMIFTADQNLSPWDDPEDEAPYAQILEVGLRDVCAVLECGDPNHIDKVMYRDGNEVRLEPTAWDVPDAFYDANGEQLSDHPAISAAFAWSRHGGATPN